VRVLRRPFRADSGLVRITLGVAQGYAALPLRGVGAMVEVPWALPSAMLRCPFGAWVRWWLATVTHDLQNLMDTCFDWRWEKTVLTTVAERLSATWRVEGCRADG